MKESICIENKEITIYFENKLLENKLLEKKLPVIICNSNYENKEKLLSECNKMQYSNFVFVSISNINWNDDLSPWYMKKTYSKDSDYLGKADAVSGSMWFENFEKFVQENDINSNVKKIYFSLGNKEKQTNNPILKNVEEKTIAIEKIIESK